MCFFSIGTSLSVRYFLCTDSIYVRYFLFTYSLSVNNIFQIRLVIRMIEIMDSHLGLRFGLEIRLRIGMGIGIWDLK